MPHSLTSVVHGGDVPLDGKVRTWVKREVAIRTACSAPSITSIKNIKVKPFAYT